MNIDMVIGGFILTCLGEREQLSPVIRPSEQDLYRLLEYMRDRTGVLTIRNNFADESGPYQLSLYSQDNNYLLLLSEFDIEGEHNVRTPNNDNASGNCIDILGEMHSDKTLVQNFDFIYRVFKEFFNTGNVSKELLN
ncbi:DUF6911 family protein [Photorhabdus akhurstii]|uniref:DUF6911 family protein n=1 Tax=Photorhabdus akhurstii TaxID=171438 RepID=UPI001BD39C57|nr:hypothetical protein [Photorhabdus akhurstii]MBS9427527.1 hypothetical protein [Photorhabdus akhurstii]